MITVLNNWRFATGTQAISAIVSKRHSGSSGASSALDTITSPKGDNVVWAMINERHQMRTPLIERSAPLNQIERLVVDASNAAAMPAHVIDDGLDDVRLREAALMQVGDN